MTEADAALAKTDILSAIVAYLQNRFPLLGTVDAATPLLHTGAIDSLGFLEVMTFLTEKFGVTLEEEDFDRANLETPDALANFVGRKL